MTSSAPSHPTATDIQAIFNQIAPQYDQLNDRLSFGLHRIWKQMTVSWCGAQIGNTVLDVCCGSGDLTQRLAQQVGASGQVFGLDFAANLLAIAQQQNEQRYNPYPITWIEGDALALPFAANTFDAATMGYGLRNVTDISQSLRELHRVLNVGAKVAILDFHRPANPWMQQFQTWYLQNLVVPAAEQCGMKDEYAYINPSIERFPMGSAQVQLADQAGFSQAVHYPIAGGLMGVLVATK
ncbi:MAG: bifunctional demethylmenaquinone methyltransferase/2-methoxy-6-polyprenyl-1,4-benzoquinol methylase UbiE [Synechococcales cyanobacterium T60_A2020_003]|nr:bifunctional demethylmenaquinone methyltransferase/2-methoxy-6-polyprenyl-1,4-benzoquinol methylase UbiE [Synechococcales cyanobacterium T60_A2020_003]